MHGQGLDVSNVPPEPEDVAVVEITDGSEVDFDDVGGQDGDDGIRDEVDLLVREHLVDH